MDCINLREQFGDRFKVAYEESYYTDHGENAHREDPGYMILLCQHGHICPWGGEDLAACTRRPGQIVNRLKALPFTEVVQDGDDGANVVFPVEHFEEAAEIMLPRKRRRPTLSDERRAELAERMRNINHERQSQAAESDHLSDPEVVPV